MSKALYDNGDAESLYPKIININSIDHNNYNINQIIENRILNIKKENNTNNDN